MIYEATKARRICYDKKNYKPFENYKDVETLLNMKKEEMDLPSYWWYKKKYIGGNTSGKKWAQLFRVRLSFVQKLILCSFFMLFDRVDSLSKINSIHNFDLKLIIKGISGLIRINFG